jgi:hypothetical protein
MEDYGIIATIIVLLITQLFYLNRTIGKLQAKMNFCIKEIRRLNKQLKILLNNRYTTLNNDRNA